MAGNVFLTRSSVPPARWREAFPGVSIVHRFPPKLPADAMLWLHNPSADDIGLVRNLPGVKFVVLHDEPADSKGLAALEAGAAGYANAHASPDILRTIATVIRNQGVWVGETLLARMLRGVSPPEVHDQLAEHPDLVGLSEREREVALRVARGESNKEIARALNIAERTVKAHLSAVFDRFGVRDRLQLAVMLRAGAPAKS